MKTRLSFDIDSKELEAQLKDWVETKLRHLAVGNVESIVKKEYKDIITKQIEMCLDGNVKSFVQREGLANWIKKMVEETVTNKVHSLLYNDFYEKINDWVKVAVNDTVVKCFNEFNVEELINKSISECIQSEAYKVAKEKLKGIFETV